MMQEFPDIPLQKLKQHVRADDFTEDDAMLQSLLDAALAKAVRDTNRTLPELVAMGGGLLPPDLQHAVLMLAGYWYSQRESASSTPVHAVPYGYDALVKPFRRLGKTEEEGVL